MSISGAAAPAYTAYSVPEDSCRVAAPIRWALCLLAFSTPLEYPGRFAYEVTTMTGALFVLATLLQLRTCYRRLPWAVACFALYFNALLIALVTTGATYPGGQYLSEVAAMLEVILLRLLCCWACTNLLPAERLCRAVLWSLIVGCVVRAALPLTDLARTARAQGIGGDRVTALGQNPNQSATVLALGALALIGLTYVQSRASVRARFLAWGAVGVIAAAMVQTGSRGGLLSLTIGLMVLLSTGKTLRLRVRNTTAALLALSIMGVFVARSSLMRARIELAQEGRLSQREKIFPLLVGMFKDKPWLGWGPVTNKYELASRLRDPDFGRRDPHNVLLEVATSSGLLGGLPFLVGLGLCVRAAWRARSGRRGILPLAMVLAVVTASMSGNRLAAPLLWLVLAYALTSTSDERAPPGRLATKVRSEVPLARVVSVWRARHSGNDTWSGRPSVERHPT